MPINAHKLILAMAVRYLDAARVLHKNSPAPNALWEPLNHLFAMSAELALKAFLERSGLSEKELRVVGTRHSLNALLLLAVGHGLRTNRGVVEVLVTMHDAHFSNLYRYVPRPDDGEVVTVLSAHPAEAIWAIEQLLDQCAEDPAEVRKHTALPGDWPAAVMPVHPVAVDELQDWIAEKRRLRALFDKKEA